MQQVKAERTGWRDLQLNDRHRRWGWDCPAIDLDVLFLEYDRGRAVAIVEYKHEEARTQYSSHPSYRALIDLGERASLPVFACRYAADFSWYRVVPLNHVARQHLSDTQEMTEMEWVAFLYKLRGYDVPDDVLTGLSVEI